MLKLRYSDECTYTVRTAIDVDRREYLKYVSGAKRACKNEKNKEKKRDAKARVTGMADERP